MDKLSPKKVQKFTFWPLTFGQTVNHIPFATTNLVQLHVLDYVWSIPELEK